MEVSLVHNEVWDYKRDQLGDQNWGTVKVFIHWYTEMSLWSDASTEKLS